MKWEALFNIKSFLYMGSHLQGILQSMVQEVGTLYVYIKNKSI